MTELSPLLQLAISLAVGLLIGLERGWDDREAEEGTRVAGVRTYGLIGLTGGVLGLLTGETGVIVIGLAFVALTAAMIAGYFASKHADDDVGITSMVAGMLTFCFGAAATRGYATEAASGAVVTALLLEYKDKLHHWVRALDLSELRATLLLLLISIVILPVIPNQTYGPWDALNPYEIWWMVVLIAGISFLGYFAMKIAGAGKGALLTGLFSGLASSTALTLHFSRLARSEPEARGMLAPGILVACGMMFPRMVVVATIVHAPMLPALILPAAVMGLIVFAAAGIQWWLAEQGEETKTATLKNPLELRSALMFGAFLAAVMLAAEGLDAAFGDAGVLALAAVSGITDVDAITLTLSRMSAGEIPIGRAAFGVVLAGAVNSLVKGGMTLAIGGPAFGMRVAAPLALAAVTGLAIAWFAGDLSAGTSP